MSLFFSELYVRLMVNGNALLYRSTGMRCSMRAIRTAAHASILITTLTPRPWYNLVLLTKAILIL